MNHHALASDPAGSATIVMGFLMKQVGHGSSVSVRIVMSRDMKTTQQKAEDQDALCFCTRS